MKERILWFIFCRAHDLFHLARKLNYACQMAWLREHVHGNEHYQQMLKEMMEVK
jgi:hypothetical protein